MHKIEVSEKDQFFIGKKLVIGSMELTPGKVHLLSGENGIGKSTFINYIKRYQKNIFEGLTCNFTDQLRLTPLNEVSCSEVQKSLKFLQKEELNIYHDISIATQGYLCSPIRFLSGGQNQMIKLQISLFLGGDIFIFDEPLQYLDQTNKILFMDLLKKLKALGKTIILVEHNEDIVRPLVDQNYRMTMGHGQIMIQDGDQ